eukprot:GFUD01037635.1.p1 GENE.GFUD01037635.1~~GFUD01037635.1.p1  ORF type:complete len:380 (-),score=133.68 GFUD01037635.1:148-1242(-)
MLCPDVINFKSSLKHESKVNGGKLTDPNYETLMKTFLQSEGNIFGVKIVLPSSGPVNTTENIVKVLTEDTDYYVVENNFDMSVIFDKTFHHNFVLSGDLSLSTISSSPTISSSSTISLASSLLTMSLPGEDSLTHSLRQVLTKNGKTKDNTCHYQQHMKLLNLKTSQVKKVENLLKLAPLHSPVGLAWTHPDPSICPSSLARYLADKAMQVQVRSIVVDLHTQYNMQVPIIEKDQFCDWDSEHISDLEEWLGGVLLQLPPDSIPAPPPCTTAEQVTTIQATGLFSTITISRLMTAMAMYLTSTPSTPWVSVSVLGPEQRTLLSGRKCLQTSDSVSTVILTREGEWVARQSRSTDYTNCKPSKYA